MNVNVNENCVGCGLCAGICPEVFTMTDAGAAAARPDIPEGQEGMIREAADSCPAAAIEVDI